MSRGTWNKIKQSKSFYVTVYRRATGMLISLLIVNIVLLIGIAYRYFYMPERQFYATSGMTPPVELSPGNAPNYSAGALLPPDPVSEVGNKVIPK